MSASMAAPWIDRAATAAAAIAATAIGVRAHERCDDSLVSHDDHRGVVWVRDRRDVTRGDC